MLSFIIGISSGILILIILIIIIAFIIKRKKTKKSGKFYNLNITKIQNYFFHSELNLYYTCEQPIHPEKRSNYLKTPVGYFQASLNDVSQQDNKPISYNSCVERQLLLNNLSQYQKFNTNNTNNNNNNSVFFYNNNQNNEYEKASSISQSNRSILKTSLKSLSNIQTSEIINKDSPNSFTTTTTSIDTGTTTSSSSYYATPDHTKISTTRSSAFKGTTNKTSHKNPVRFDLINNNNNRNNRNNSVLLSAYSTPSLIDPFKNDENIEYKQFSSSTTSKSTPNLMTNLLNNIVPSDICVETVGSNGAKLSLDCGNFINLLSNC
jgi:hypothetical protein